MSITDDPMSEMHGAMTALVTPFRDGQIDWSAVDRLVDRQVEAGIDWIVPCGTTGESPTLSQSEHEELLERTIAQAKACGSRNERRCRVMAGTGSNCTAESIRKTKHAEKAGADAAMLVTPYYNRPPQEGLFRHYAAVAEAVELPLVLYDVPARTGVTISIDTVVRLRERYPHFVAIKNATGSVDAVTELRSRCDIAVLSGDDHLTWPMMAVGAVGVISVISNLFPHLLESLVTAARNGRINEADEIHRRVYDLAKELAKHGPNPIPIKTAMTIAGLIQEEFRLPLCPVDAPARQRMEEYLASQPRSGDRDVATGRYTAGHESASKLTVG